MNIFLIIIVILEALGILFIGWRLIRLKKFVSKVTAKSQFIKNRALDFDDIEITGVPQSQENIMSEAFNSIKNNMQTFLEASKENVVILSDALEVLNSNAEKNKSGSRKTVKNLETVANKIDEQSELVKSSLNLIDENTARISEIELSVKEISLRLNETVDECKHGLESINICGKNMGSVSENLAQSEKILQDFSEKIHEINVIGAFISEISESLNLLSLNATIEAARAGDAGKGFAVVAHEMSGMAEKTGESISNINSILSNVISSSEKIKDCINASVSVFSDSIQEFDGLSSSFRFIDSKSAHINDMMKDIHSRIETIDSNSKESQSKANGAFEATEQIVSGTREIEKVSDETAEASMKMSENITALNSMLFNLKNLLKQYKTSVTPVTDRPSHKIKIGIHCIDDNDFWHSVRRGIIYAKNELEALGAEVRYLPFASWDDVVSLPDSFSKMLEEGFDGFICPGFMANTPEKLGTAHNMGKKVFLFNCDTDNPAMRDAVFQPDSYESGQKAASEMIKALKKNGRIAIVHGPMHVASNKLRYDGFTDKISAAKDFRIIDVAKVTNEEEETYRAVQDFISKHPDLNGVYVTCGTPLAAARAIENSGKNIALVVFDHSKEIYEYIKKGIIVAAIGQDPFGQGHDPIVYMYNSLVTGKPVPESSLKCRQNIVDRNIVDSLI